MRYPLNPEDEIGYPKEGQEVLLELMDRAALAFADKVCFRIAKDLLEEGLSPEKIKRITSCDVEQFTSTTH